MLSISSLIEVDGVQVPGDAPVFSVVLGLGKAHAIVSHVKFSIESPNKDITQDPERSRWGRDVNAHEAKQADHDSSLLHLQNYHTIGCQTGN